MAASPQRANGKVIHNALTNADFVVSYSMKLRMRLNKKEAKFLADNLTKWAEVTAVEVNDVEVRIHGVYELSDELKKLHKQKGWDDYHAGTGSTAYPYIAFETEHH